MKTSSFLKITAAAVLFFHVTFASGCFLRQGSEGRDHVLGSRTYGAGFEETWDALHAILTSDLGYPLDKDEKKGGKMVTSWISIMRPESTIRGKLVVKIEEEGGLTTVTFKQKVEIYSPGGTKIKDKDGMIAKNWRVDRGESVFQLEHIFKSLEEKLGIAGGA